MTFWHDIGEPVWLSMHLPIMYIMFRSEDIGRYNCPEVTKSSKKVTFGPPICRGKEHPTFQRCIFKSHLLPTMWSDMVEFRSASSAGSWRKLKERKKKERIPVKYRSADNYVGRFNKIIVKLFQCFISHVTTSETEMKIIILAAEGVLKLFQNYFRCIEHVGK